MTEPRAPRPAGDSDTIVLRDVLARGRDHLARVPASVRQRWRSHRTGAREARAARPVGELVAGLPVGLWLLLALLAGLALRLYYWQHKAGIHYPDELFQYLEPAYWRTHGFAWLPWEFERGARNWLLVFHYGSIMELGERLGLESLALYRFIWLHNAVLSLALVPAGYRLGRAAGRGDARLGVMLAMAMAVFPIFGYFAPHTLSEWHGLLFTTWAYALWMEQIAEPERFGRWRRAFAVGLLLGGGIIARYTLVLWLPLVLLDYNFRARFRELFTVLAGVAGALALLGLVDALTWGKPFHSVIEYFRFNYVEGGAATLEVKTGDYYWRMLIGERLGPGRVVLLAGIAFGLLRYWRLVLAWVIPFVALSRVGIKQERFLLSMWPLFLASALGGLLHAWDLVGRLGLMRRAKGLRRAWRAALPVVLLATWVSVLVGVYAMPMRWKAGIFAAQAWIGEQPDATGVLLDDRIHLNGGYLLLNRNVPQVPYERGSLNDAIFNYIALYEPRHIERVDRRPDFEEVARFEEVVVFRRTDGLAGR